VNNGDLRITAEQGEPGQSFFSMRIDKVLNTEKQVSSIPGAAPATMGNVFKLGVSDSGAIDIRALGEGRAGSNTNGFHLSIADGRMSMHFAGPIEISHGDNDVSNNSVVLDPDNGIDITAKNGLRFNGSELATRALVDWLNKYQTNLCQVTQIGGPAPIHPAALPDFMSGVQSLSENGGFTTSNSGPAAQKTITDNDNFTSV
jgi:hypothetical protein